MQVNGFYPTFIGKKWMLVGAINLPSVGQVDTNKRFSDPGMDFFYLSNSSGMKNFISNGKFFDGYFSIWSINHSSRGKAWHHNNSSLQRAGVGFVLADVGGGDGVEIFNGATGQFREAFTGFGEEFFNLSPNAEFRAFEIGGGNEPEGVVGIGPVINQDKSGHGEGLTAVGTAEQDGDFIHDKVLHHQFVPAVAIEVGPEEGGGGVVMGDEAEAARLAFFVFPEAFMFDGVKFDGEMGGFGGPIGAVFGECAGRLHNLRLLTKGGGESKA